MDHLQICGTEWERMLRGGLRNLRAREREINDLNVFPVPDGDTGTNMRLTLENGLQSAPSRRPTGAYLKGVANGMLLGARGNSGVILSQLFQGIFLELQHRGYVNSPEFCAALVRGYKTAYAAVVKPVEGTVLTVAREAAEKIRSVPVSKNIPVEAVLSRYLYEMKQSLKKTPKLLPVLAEAGVVDSGAMGYIVLCEGMLLALRGEADRIGIADPAEAETSWETESAIPDTSLFNEWSPFTDGYCLEFVLQRMQSSEYSRKYRPESFREDLCRLGESVAAVENGLRVKVHVHTLRPEKIIALAREYGEFVTFKMENMQLQHSTRDVRLSRAPRTSFARVAVASGSGTAALFREMGCEAVIDGGRTMNPSAQQFCEAFARVNAEKICVLPNNKNTAMAARQAGELYKKAEVVVLDTSSVAEGYYALAMDVADSDDTEYRLRQMREGAARVTTFAAAEASRDASVAGIPIADGQAVAFCGHSIIAVNETSESALADAFRKAAAEGKSYECFFVFCSDFADEAAKEKLSVAIGESFPLADVTFLDGGQDIYRFIAGAV